MIMAERKLQPKVILVADRTLSANYPTLFDGMFATMQTTQVPSLMMKHFVAPPVPTDKQARAEFAPIGLRRIQSALIKYNQLDIDDVVCTTPEALQKLLGPWVEIVAVSSSDPLGHGMSNTTTSNFWKGELYTWLFTRQLLEVLYKAKQKYNFKIIGGGAGAWQWKAFPDDTARRTLDVVYEGYFESAGCALFEEILSGKSIDHHVQCNDSGVDRIVPIKEASIFGSVELSRGCGRGCCFCSMSDQKMEHLPAYIILADIETNIAAGLTSVVSTSEDLFRYGAVGLRPDFEKLTSLLDKMRRIRGIGFMQIDHVNVTSAAQLTNEQLCEIKRLLSWNISHKHLWVNLGVESASGELVKANCPGKVAPYDADDWAELVKETALRLLETGYTPVLSLVLGLPGETPGDISLTQKLVNSLGDKGVVIFPIFYEPVDVKDYKSQDRFTIEEMRLDHLNLYRSCYEINFRNVPGLIYDNQTAAGVKLTKRVAMQMLGKVEIMNWRRAFNKIGKKLADSSLSAQRSVGYAS